MQNNTEPAAAHLLARRSLPFLALLVVSACAAPAGVQDAQLFRGPSVDLERGALQVSPNQRYLVHSDGTPFFWLGDTAWELFHRLDREEAERYLEDRRSKGFTVIQAVVLAELDGLRVPNPYGEVPLLDLDPARPNEAYFQHVDHIVDRAAAKGMYIGMLPTWGDKFNRKWGVGPEVFTAENARIYGEYLGRRYGNKPIVWILGGDRNPENEEHLAITRAIAEGIRSQVGDRQLMTYHPQGGSSSWQWFHEDDWLDFNMFQSGHQRYDIPNYQTTLAGYRLNPIKPVLDGEPRYEDHPVNWRPEEGWFDEFDVRQAAYWSMLSGAAGHTYGDHNIWQMWQPGREPISSARTPWRQAVHHPGSRQMGHLRHLFTARPFHHLEPDQEAIEDPGEGAGHQRAARAVDGSFLLAYTPLGRPLSVRLDRLRGGTVRAYWFDPRTGAVQEIGSFRGAEPRTFTPPGSVGRGNDWVLVVESEVAPLEPLPR